MGLIDGQIKVRLNLGDDKDVNIKVVPNPVGSRFNDDRWHFVEISRDYKNVSIPTRGDLARVANDPF